MPRPVFLCRKIKKIDGGKNNADSGNLIDGRAAKREDVLETGCI